MNWRTLKIAHFVMHLGWSSLIPKISCIKKFKDFEILAFIYISVYLICV